MKRKTQRDCQEEFYAELVKFIDKIDKIDLDTPHEARSHDVDLPKWWYDMMDLQKFCRFTAVKVKV